MKPLTTRQHEILDHIRRYRDMTGMPPSIRDIMRLADPDERVAPTMLRRNPWCRIFGHRIRAWVERVYSRSTQRGVINVILRDRNECKWCRTLFSGWRQRSIQTVHSMTMPQAMWDELDQKGELVVDSWWTRAGLFTVADPTMFGATSTQLIILAVAILLIFVVAWALTGPEERDGSRG